MSTLFATTIPGQVFQDVLILISLTSYRRVSEHPHQCGSVVSAMEEGLVTGVASGCGYYLQHCTLTLSSLHVLDQPGKRPHPP